MNKKPVAKKLSGNIYSTFRDQQNVIKTQEDQITKLQCTIAVLQLDLKAANMVIASYKWIRDKMQADLDGTSASQQLARLTERITQDDPETELPWQSIQTYTRTKYLVCHDPETELTGLEFLEYYETREKVESNGDECYLIKMPDGTMKPKKCSRFTICKKKPANK